MMALQRESPTAADWSRRQYEALFESTAGENRSRRLGRIAEEDSEVPRLLGFLVAQCVDAEWELENMIVAEANRRRGVGARLIGELVALARAAHGNGIFLEVRESNESARAFYRKLGFEETGLRKSYYPNPPEDAILCRLRLY